MLLMLPASEQRPLPYLVVPRKKKSGVSKALQRIIPDLALNGRGLSSVGPLVNNKFLADAKTLPPCNKYAEHRVGKPNAVVNDRQRQVDKITTTGPRSSTSALVGTRATASKPSSTPTGRGARSWGRW